MESLVQEGHNCIDVRQRLQLCLSVPEYATPYISHAAYITISERHDRRVVVVFGRKNDCKEPRPGGFVRQQRRQALRNCPARGSSRGDLLADLRLRRYFTEMMV